MEVTHQLCGTMIYLGKKAETIEKGIELSREMISSGKAWEKFLEIVKSQNGDLEMVKNPENYPQSEYQTVVKAGQDGYIAAVNALETGLTSITLGAGRMKSSDKIDPKAGIVFQRKKGDAVKKGDTVLTIYTDKKEVLETAAERLAKAVSCSSEKPAAGSLILDMLDKTKL